MNALRIALAQLNMTVGDLPANADRILQAARNAAAQGAAIMVAPELSLCGYPPEDLVLKPHFIEDCHTALKRLAKDIPDGLMAIVGAPWRDGEQTHNAALILQHGAIRGVYHKMLLPNYGVFDEKRVFAAGTKPLVIEAAGARVGLHICEDSWMTDGAACTGLRELHPDLVINLSASPYHRGKMALRTQALAHTARTLGIPLLYCNLIGGQDELVFDGGSLAIDASGQIRGRAKSFVEDLLLVDVPKAGKTGARSSNDWKCRTEPLPAEPADVYAALRLGLHDYVEKNGFAKVLVSLSGGIDSALVAAIATDALGADRVVGLTMPSQFSSEETLSDAHQLAARLGIRIHEVPIRPLYEQYLVDLSKLWPGRPADATEENLQARIRGNIAMALSNKFGWLVLSTGNKSEIATGYCTLYGDMAGGLAVIKDVPKTLVWALARWRNTQGQGELIPESTIRRPPSAELRAGQLDTDSLPPYEVLDPIVERYVERDESAAEIVQAGVDPALVARVIKLIDRNEYKRRQGAPGIKITPKAFGRDRRLPITNRYIDQRTS